MQHYTSWLETQGWSDYFLDVDENRGIAPGERWMAALAGAVDRCEAVIFRVSPAWRDSKSLGFGPAAKPPQTVLSPGASGEKDRLPAYSCPRKVNQVSTSSHTTTGRAKKQ